MQAKRHIKRTEDNPGGIITVEVRKRLAVKNRQDFTRHHRGMQQVHLRLRPLQSWMRFGLAQVPIHFSNVALIDPVTAAPVRTTWRYLEDGTKVRRVPSRAALFYSASTAGANC